MRVLIIVSNGRATWRKIAKVRPGEDVTAVTDLVVDMFFAEHGAGKGISATVLTEDEVHTSYYFAMSK